MVISIKEMYLGETAEIISLSCDNGCIKRLRDMGLREGKLIDMIHYDPTVTKKIVINLDNSMIALDAELVEGIKVRPLKSYYAVLMSQANYDSLTECLNRHAANGILMEEYRKFKSFGIPLSLLLADIDHFKRINDTYGHSTGDSVLKQFSSLCKQHLRRSDCVSRWGGEEFLIILRGTHVNEAIHIAERIRQVVEAHVFQPFKGSGFVTVSIGVCGVPPCINIDDIINRADAALYSAKKGGRNRVSTCEM